MSFFGLNFGQNADVDIILDGQDDRKMAEIRDENGRKERHFLFFDGESVTGKVNVTLHRKTSRLEHQGIRIEFIGQIELYYDRGNHHEFLSLVKQLQGPGELTQNTSFDFEFNQVEKPYECYTGANVRLRYFLRVTVVRRLTDMTKEMDLLVHTLATYPEMNNPIKMEVGIEECLHIEFEYNKSKYHLKDVIVGKIYFLLVRIKIKHMEVAIIKRETTGSGPNTFHDNETIAKYEIMDGAPVKGESIPIRVFLAGYDLTPTMRDVNKKFSVKYYLNLVLVDEEERRYFKQQEITLWRKGERTRKAPGGAPGVYQIPHAMARHNPGERPSANVRTAPTPGTEPNTPVSFPNDQHNFENQLQKNQNNFEKVEQEQENFEKVEQEQENFEKVEQENIEKVDQEKDNFEKVEQEKDNFEKVEQEKDNFEKVEQEKDNFEKVDQEKDNFEKVDQEKDNFEKVDQEKDNFEKVEIEVKNEVKIENEVNNEPQKPSDNHEESLEEGPESPPPMDDLTLDDEDEVEVQDDLEDGDNDLDEDLARKANAKIKQKKKEPVPS